MIPDADKGVTFSHNDLRSGGKGGSGWFAPSTAITFNPNAAGGNMTGLSVLGLRFTYQYIIGYDVSGGWGGPDSDYPQIHLYVTNDISTGSAGSGELVYTSPHLRGRYGFSHCEQNGGVKRVSCYSPPQAVDVQLGPSALPALPTTLYLRIEVSTVAKISVRVCRFSHAFRMVLQCADPEI